jgi:hypothetical protein
MTTEPAPDRAPSEPEHRSRLGGVLAAAVLVVVVGMWVVIYVWSAVHKPVDRLHDQAFAKRAQAICSTTVDQMNQLPKPGPQQSNVDRADVVDQSDVDLRAMLDRLAAAAPTTGNDAVVMKEWLADYRTYVGDRADYARRLRTDDQAKFYVSEKDGSQITIPLDTLATANKMTSCVTPADLS